MASLPNSYQGRSKPSKIRPKNKPSLFEALEDRLLFSSVTGTGNQLSISSAGFAINAGLVQSVGHTFEVAGYANVTPSLNNGSLTYTYSGWTVKLTPTQDTAGVHFAIAFTNTGSAASVLPSFNLCDLSGMTNDYQWLNNQTGPMVLDQTLADTTHFALTIDDPDFPMVGMEIHNTSPADGTDTIEFLPTGQAFFQDLNTDYNLGIVPQVVQAGASTTFHCSLRFGSTLSSVSTATDAAFAQANPYSLTWSDHRQMMRGDLFPYDPTTANPQGFLGGFDINDPANAQKFDDYVMNYAANAIATCKAVNAGSWIEWDMEGKEQGLNYKGNPELIDVLNPGWDHTDASGAKLIDRFFAAFKAAGINIGVTIRPWTLTVDSSGTLSQDTSVSDATSLENHIDYAEKRWGIDVFYVDSPDLMQTANYRAIAQAHPNVLLIPEDAPESWEQFSAPLVWASGSNYNWVTVPRNLYGNLGWGVYFHQDLTNATTAANFTADAKLGSTVLSEGGAGGPDQPQIEAATAILASTATVSPTVTTTTSSNSSTGNTSTTTASTTTSTPTSTPVHQGTTTGSTQGEIILSHIATLLKQIAAKSVHSTSYTLRASAVSNQGYTVIKTASSTVS